MLNLSVVAVSPSRYTDTGKVPASVHWTETVALSTLGTTVDGNSGAATAVDVMAVAVHVAGHTQVTLVLAADR